MLILELMTEAAKRYGMEPGLDAVVTDASQQARHGMDAPDEVQDGMEWYADERDADIAGPVPRLVALREIEGI